MKNKQFKNKRLYKQKINKKNRNIFNSKMLKNVNIITITKIIK